MLWVSHDKVRIPNMPRMVLIIIAIAGVAMVLFQLEIIYRHLTGRKKGENKNVQ